MPNVSATTAKRSQNMRAIMSRSNATTELRLRAYLIRNRIVGWRVGPNGISGSPDFFFQRERIAVFVDGCFWHGCPRCGHTPKTNRLYWSKKLARNWERDAQITKKLRSNGIHVLRIWECQLRDKPSSCLKRLATMLRRSTGGR
jgi:DNA mismatch endonuclease (patch repair protein)